MKRKEQSQQRYLEDQYMMFNYILQPLHELLQSNSFITVWTRSNRSNNTQEVFRKQASKEELMVSTSSIAHHRQNVSPLYRFDYNLHLHHSPSHLLIFILTISPLQELGKVLGIGLIKLTGILWCGLVVIYQDMLFTCGLLIWIDCQQEHVSRHGLQTQ